MSTLYIGDIHEKADRLEELIGLHGPEASRVVLLGDYFDSWDGYGPHTEQTVDWLVKNIDKPNYYFLWGNHDLQYGCQLDNRVFQCSGYNEKTRKLCKERLTWDGFWSKLHFNVVFNDFSCTHAGWTEKSISTDFSGAKLSVQTGVFHGLFAVGKARGGNSTNPGPLWTDWKREFKPLKGMNQIVGHSEVKVIEIKTGDDSLNFNIDTGLREVLLIHGPGEWEILG